MNKEDLTNDNSLTFKLPTKVKHQFIAECIKKDKALGTASQNLRDFVKKFLNRK